MEIKTLKKGLNKLLVFLISVIVAVFIKNTAENRNIEPLLISNYKFQSLLNATKSPTKPFEDIILINGTPYSENDSTIGEAISRISQFQPRVIAIDFFLKNQNLLNYFKIHDSVNLILAVSVDDKDSLHYPVNIFKGNVHYGHVMDETKGLYLSTKLNGLISLPQKVVEVYSDSLYNKYENRGVEFDYINYPNSKDIFLSVSDSLNFDLDYLKNKIVFFGYFGNSEINPVPQWDDNSDIHETPIGTQFGSFILYSEIYTMLGNFIEQVPKWLDNLLCICLCIFCIFISSYIMNFNPMIAYVVIKLLSLVMIFILSFSCLLFFFEFNLLPDYRFLCWTVIITFEINFWFSLRNYNRIYIKETKVI